MSTQENVQIVKDFFAAMGRGDKRGLQALSAEDIEWIIPGEDWPLAGTHHGHAGLADLLQKASEMGEISYPKPPEFVAQGDRVLVVGFARGRIIATNKTFEDHWVFAITVRNGKLTNIREYIDTQALARASEMDASPRARNQPNNTENDMNTITFTKTAAPEWLLAMWKEIDDKTFGKGFDCFAEDAVCNLGVADWHGREAIRENLRAFIDTGFTAHHEVVEYWDSPTLKVFHGKVGMKFNDPSLKPVRPTMSHFFYMDPKDPTKVSHWIGAVGPTGF